MVYVSSDVSFDKNDCLLNKFFGEEDKATSSPTHFIEGAITTLWRGRIGRDTY